MEDLLYYGGYLASDIAILTPYSSQRILLKQRLKRFISKGLFVDSIDKAQGTERSLILLSLVRSSATSRSIGFVSDPRRLNVAITRAKFGLIVVGNAATLIQGEHSGCWLSFLKHLNSLGCIAGSDLYRKNLTDILANYDIDEAKLVKKDKPELKMEFTYLRRGRILSEGDRKILVRELVNLAVKLVHSKEYLFWLDWILRLPEHCYGANNQPDDPVKKDQKSWSHITELFRFGIPRDAANLTLLDYSPEAKIMAEFAPDGRNRNKRLPKGLKNHIREKIDAAFAKTPLTAVGTLGSVSSNKYGMNKRVYAFALLDEAAQSPEYETICALVRLALNAGVCFAGDYKQLPPFSRNHKVKQMVHLSMMERLSHIPDVKHVLLRIQYRMVEVIARWPSNFFYDSELQTDLALHRARIPPRGFYWPGWPTPMAFVHHETDQQMIGTSVQNVHAVDVIEGSNEQRYL